MIKSRLDLYRPTDDIIEEDPAYQGYNIDDLREDAKKLGRMLYGQPGGVPDLADLVQGTARIIEPIQKAITPEEITPNIILLDVVKDRFEFPELKRVAMEQYKYWEPESVIVEAKASGLPLIQELRQVGIPVINFTPSKGNDKLSRVHAVAPVFESGAV